MMLKTEYCLVQGICGKTGFLPVGVPLLFAWGQHPDFSGSGNVFPAVGTVMILFSL